MNILELQRRFWELKNGELIPTYNSNQREGLLYYTNQQYPYGYSLEEQYQQMLNYCEKNNIQVLRKYEDSPGKMKNRPTIIINVRIIKTRICCYMFCSQSIKS